MPLPLPTNRTSADTIAEHVADHNLIHQEVNDIADDIDADINAHKVAANDHAASVVSFSPIGDIAATDVQAAVAELDTDKLATTTAAGIYIAAPGTPTENSLAPLPFFNVKDYGATGGGVADDTAEIIAAIADVVAEGGGILWFPQGTYNVSSTITGNQAVILAGLSSELVEIVWTGGALPVFDYRDQDEFQIRGIKIDGASTATYGIRMGNTTGSVHPNHIETVDVWVENCVTTGIDTGSGNTPGAISDSRFEKVVVASCGNGYEIYGQGVSLHGGVIADNTTSAIIAGNAANYSAHGTIFTGGAVHILVPSGASTVNTLSHHGCWFETAQTFDNAATSVSMTNLTFSGCFFSTGSGITNMMDFTGVTAALVVVSGGRVNPSATTRQITMVTGVTVIDDGSHTGFTYTGTGTRMVRRGQSFEIDSSEGSPSFVLANAGTTKLDLIHSVSLDRNFLRAASALDIGATGSTTPSVRVNTTDPADGATALLVRRNVGGTLTLQTVSMGATDSGGVGFKVLRVPN